jgi:outer membrane lipoprotein carrier protein
MLRILLASLTLTFAAAHAGGDAPPPAPAKGAAKKPASTKKGPKKAAGKPEPQAASRGPQAASEPQAQSPAAAIAARVQKFYARTDDFSASFTQHYTYASMGRTTESSGTVQVKKPGRLRWEYLKPEPKLIVIDGKTYSQWMPEDNQLVVNRNFSADTLSSAFTFLWGKGELLTEFTARTVLRPADLPQGDALELTPKSPSGQIEKLLFVVGKDGQVLASVVTDPQANVNKLVFTDAKVNGSLPDALFQFEAPKGANVQELK